MTARCKTSGGRFAWALAALLVACHGSSGTDGGALVSTTAATSGASTARTQTPPHSTGSAGASKVPLCRAITVTGSMHRVGTISLPDAGAVVTGELAGEVRQPIEPDGSNPGRADEHGEFKCAVPP